jgi:predicted DNA-binding protein YlxM (UPF0122 family)
MRKRQRKITNEKLIKRYCVEKLGVAEISKLHKMSRYTVTRRLKALNVKLRTAQEAQALRKQQEMARERSRLTNMLLKKLVEDPDSAFLDIDTTSQGQG